MYSLGVVELQQVPRQCCVAKTLTAGRHTHQGRPNVPGVRPDRRQTFPHSRKAPGRCAVKGPRRGCAGPRRNALVSPGRQWPGLPPPVHAQHYNTGSLQLSKIIVKIDA